MSTSGRVCFTLQVRPDRLEEYRERHRSVWPEMQDALRTAGWRDYSLHLRDDGLLVGILTCADFPAAREAMERTDVNARWQAEMRDFFVDLDGRDPDAAMAPLPEIFHLS